MTIEARSRLSTMVVGVLLAAGTFVLFSRALPYDFINYDDPAFVVNNPHVQRGVTWEGVRWAFAVDRDYWHPLTWLSLMVDRAVLGGGATGFRAVNLGWHAINALLVFLLLRRMNGGLWLAASCAAVFAWHPQRVESVVWITERKDVLSGFFALLAVWAWLGYGEARAKGTGRAIAWYLAALATFACGLMSKSVVVTLPFLLLALDFWPLRRFEGAGAADGGSSRFAPAAAGRLIVEKLPFLALSLAVGLFTVSTQTAAGAFGLDLTLDQRVANAVVSVLRYLGMFAWPSGLAVLYPHPGDWPLAILGAAGVVVSAVTLLAWWYRHERPALLVGWSWFLLLLLPTLGLVQVGLQAMADRYSYLPSVGLVLALGGVLGPVLSCRSPAGRSAAGVVGVAVLALLGAGTWRQQAVWRDAEALFTHAIAVTRDNYVARTALALERLAQNRVPEAVTLAEEAIAIAPEAPLALDTLGAVRLAQGRVDEAVEAYRRVIALQPGSVSARCDLGRILLAQGRLDEAAQLFTEAAAIRPVSVPAHLGLADAAIARARPEEALGHLARALEIAPRDARTTMRVAAVQLQVGRREQAVATLRLAAGLEPDNVALQRDVGDVLGQLGRFEDAAALYERAVLLDPTDAATHARLGYIHFLLKRPAEAIRSWEEARRLDPGMTELDARIRQARALLPAQP
jgi:tetratricopeptide (TPR) repeat protein